MKKNPKNNTGLFILFAFVFHLAFLVTFYVARENIIEVKLSSKNFSTNLGFIDAKSNTESKTIQEALTKTAEKITEKTLPKITKQKILSVPKNDTLKANATPKPIPNKIPQTSPAPQPTVASTTAPSSSGTAGGGESQVQEDIHRYINQIARILDQNKRYPRLSKENGEQGTVSIKLVLDSSGKLIEYTITKPPPYERLSAATIETIKSAVPFPPLPQSYSKPQLIIEVPVRFRLSNSSSSNKDEG